MLYKILLKSHILKLFHLLYVVLIFDIPNYLCLLYYLVYSYQVKFCLDKGMKKKFNPYVEFKLLLVESLVVTPFHSSLRMEE